MICVGRDAALHPLLQRGLHVERIRTGSAAAVRHSRGHEQAVKALHVSHRRRSILPAAAEQRITLS